MRADTIQLFDQKQQEAVDRRRGLMWHELLRVSAALRLDFDFHPRLLHGSDGDEVRRQQRATAELVGVRCKSALVQHELSHQPLHPHTERIRRSLVDDALGLEVQSCRADRHVQLSCHARTVHRVRENGLKLRRVRGNDTQCVADEETVVHGGGDRREPIGGVLFDLFVELIDARLNLLHQLGHFCHARLADEGTQTLHVPNGNYLGLDVHVC